MAKKKCPEFENHERWLISFADMLTLLFATFVVLYALNLDNASSDEEKLAGSMQEAFNRPLDDIPMDRRTGPGHLGWGIFENMAGNSFEKPLLEKFPTPENQVQTILDESRAVRLRLEERLYGPHKHRQPEDPGAARLVTVEQTSKGFKVVLGARYFYSTGSTKVNPKARPQLDQVILALKELGRPVTVEGHTDNIPPRGELTNWDISTLRATEILRYMVREHHFPPSKLSAAGYADLRPMSANTTAAGRALNRRVEFHVHYEQGDQTPP